jgi:hypothetical protein
LQSLAAEAVTFGLTAAGSMGAGNIDVVCHTGLRLVVRTLLHTAGYRRFGVAIAFCIFHYEHPPYLYPTQWYNFSMDFLFPVYACNKMEG